MKTASYSASSPPKWALLVLNQLFELEKKLSVKTPIEPSTLQRHITKIKDAFEEQGLFYQDPTGEVFNETRTDLDASVSGTGTGHLHVVEVLKPIIREGTRDMSRVTQKGIVIVEAKQPAN